MIDFEKRYNEIKNGFEKRLGELPADIPPRLQKSMEYSLLGGGKRLRPILFLSVLDAYNIKVGDAEMKIAAAIECIHTYSLIHDDLPALDNDSVRRGRATNHVVFGEATALLAGDALLNYAYELLFSVSQKPEYLEAAALIAAHAGTCGMIGGQAIEFENDIRTAGEPLLMEIYDKKCGKLISAAILAAAVISKCRDYGLWQSFGRDFGLCFQLKDDLLDAEAQTDYGTLLHLWGKERAETELAVRTKKMLSCLKDIDADTSFISALVSNILIRNSDGM